MHSKVNEAQIFLAVQAIHSSRKLSVRKAAQIYDILKRTLAQRVRGAQPRAGRRDQKRPLTVSEEEELVLYILDLDSRGFPPRFSSVRDMANLLRATRREPPVGKQWPYRFVQANPKLKTRFSRGYDF